MTTNNQHLRDFITDEIAKAAKPGERVKDGVEARVYDALNGKPATDWDLWGLIEDGDFESGGDKTPDPGAFIVNWTQPGRGQFG